MAPGLAPREDYFLRHAASSAKWSSWALSLMLRTPRMNPFVKPWSYILDRYWPAIRTAEPWHRENGSFRMNFFKRSLSETVSLEFAWTVGCYIAKDSIGPPRSF